MDRELLSIRNALTDIRVQIAHQFQQMTETVDRQSFGCFLVIYCRQAALLSHWMSDWNEQIKQKTLAADNPELADIFSKISEKLFSRYQALDVDATNISQWAVEQLNYDPKILDEKLAISAGMKQLRFISQECIKREYHVSWLLVMTEVERLRIVHGFTLIKLCELFFGRSVLRCFSHIHYQHQNQNELFSLCEQALQTHIKLHKANVQSMIAEVKTAIDAYARFIDDCYKVSLQKVEHVKSTAK